MKNIFLGSFCILVVLPQVSFGADQTSAVTNPKVAICNQQADPKSVAFFYKQSQERGAFMKANPDIIAALDLRGKWLLSHKDGQIYPDSPQPPGPTPEQASIYAAFMAKQSSESKAFLDQLNQEKQHCLNS